MKKTFLLCLICIYIITGCTSLYSKNQSKNTSRSKQNDASFFSSLFGGDNEESEPEIHSSNGNGERGRLSLPEETRSLPNQNNRPQAFQAPRQNLYTNMAPLNLTHIEGNTWRTSFHPNMVFGIMARILSQTYIVSSADRKNLNLQTDWDKFFIDGRLFRNRLSVIVFPVGERQTEVVIKNMVEYYTGNPSKQEENAAWLPSPDITDEVYKLVDNTNRQTTYAYSQSLMRGK